MIIDLNPFKFSSVVDLPSHYEVYDFSKSYDPNRKLSSPFGVGKYNEERPGMYHHQQFSNTRNIHMGIDIGAPIGTPIKNFYEGNLLYLANNKSHGDYGYTLVIRYNLSLQGQLKTLYALYGHLSAKSFDNKEIGMVFKKGDILAWVGKKSENGGWNPHLHFQLSWIDPLKADMPGVVSEIEREKALKIYPDPRIVLGNLYD